MSRQEKITKLCRAIRAYRGVREVTPGKDPRWVKSPQPDKKLVIVKWLAELGLSVSELEYINSFKTIDEFDQWVKTIQ